MGRDKEYGMGASTNDHSTESKENIIDYVLSYFIHYVAGLGF